MTTNPTEAPISGALDYPNPGWLETIASITQKSTTIAVVHFGEVVLIQRFEPL